MRPYSSEEADGSTVPSPKQRATATCSTSREHGSSGNPVAFWLSNRDAGDQNPQSLPHSPYLPLSTIASQSPGMEASILHSPKTGSLGSSIRLSDMDAADDAALAGDSQHHVDPFGPSSADLVMPSLALPKPRPFTERGQRMGNLRVVVAGRRGAGKTSLIRGIVESCEDIVHADAARPVQFAQSQAAQSSVEFSTAAFKNIKEVTASTKAYPSWWTNGLRAGKDRTRRKRSEEVKLERNLCFVDITDVDIHKSEQARPRSSTHEDIGRSDLALQYVEARLQQTAALNDMNDTAQLHLLSGRSTPLVDIVLFLFSAEKLVQEDLQMFHQLSALCSVIPLIAKSDLLSPDALESTKQKIIQGLQAMTPPNNPFIIGQDATSVMVSLEHDQQHEHTHSKDPKITESLAFAVSDTAPFAVCSTRDLHTDEMDVSVLMSSTYRPPLKQSQLPALIRLMFEPDTVDRLHHLATVKYLSWRASHQSSILSQALKRIAPEQTRRSSDSIVQRLHPHTAPPTLHYNQNMSDLDRARWLLQCLNAEVQNGTIGLLETSGVRNEAGLVNSAQKLMLDNVTKSARKKSRQTSCLSNDTRRDGKQVAAWARQRQGLSYRTACAETDPADPLGLIKVWQGWAHVLAWSIAGGIAAGIVSAVTRAWHDGWNFIVWR